jgi:hypothetical protein
MPDEERRELVRSYERRGLTTEQAQSVADRLMEQPKIALQQLARDELGLDPDAPGNPLREGILTGIATGLGTFIPLLPFLFLPSSVAVWMGGPSAWWPTLPWAPAGPSLPGGRRCAAGPRCLPLAWGWLWSRSGSAS